MSGFCITTAVEPMSAYQHSFFNSTFALCALVRTYLRTFAQLPSAFSKELCKKNYKTFARYITERIHFGEILKVPAERPRKNAIFWYGTSLLDIGQIIKGQS